MITYNKNLLARVAQKYGLRFVILHGSYATGKARPDSDLDIAALSTRPMKPQTFFSLQGALARIFGNDAHRELDFKMLEHTDPLFRFEVIRDGVLLSGNRDAYENYKLTTLRLYDDAMPLFALEKKLIRKFQHRFSKTFVTSTI